VAEEELVRVAGGPTNPNPHVPANVAAHPPDAAVWEPNTVTEVESGAHCLTPSLSNCPRVAYSMRSSPPYP